MERTRCIRYSEALRRKVVEEIECGKYSISGAMKVYDIGGSTTIQGDVRNFV